MRLYEFVKPVWSLGYAMIQGHSKYGHGACAPTMIINMRERATEQEVQHASDPELHQFKDSCWGRIAGKSRPDPADLLAD